MSDASSLSFGYEASSASDEEIIPRALRAVREHLNMDVGYLSEFVGDTAVLRYVDAPGLEHMVAAGDTLSLNDIYCRHILDGRLPELIPDTAAIPYCETIPITRAVPIGSHVSVPIRRADGSAYGMFCCLSTQANPTLNDRDLATMRVFADLSTREVQQSLLVRAERAEVHARLDAALTSEGIEVHYQPIFTLADRLPTGVEALTRFQATPYRSPDLWFAEADTVGRKVEFEIATLGRALQGAKDLQPDLSLSVNASPETVISDALPEILADFPLERLVLEVTEHVEITDYDALNQALTGLRMRGVRLAVDDAGAGYAGLQHILSLRPDFIKLDMSLVRNVDTDQARRSLSVAMCHYASETGAILIAEGIETQAEFDALRQIGVERGQGYLLGRPAPLNDLFAMADTDTRAAPSKKSA